VASFLSGTLDTPIAGAYERLAIPILLVWGKDAVVTPLEHARGFRQFNARTELRVFDCGALPTDEVPDEFVGEVSTWLRSGARSRRQP